MARSSLPKVVLVIAMVLGGLTTTSLAGAALCGGPKIKGICFVPGVRINFANLSGINLSGVNLSGDVFFEDNLTGANLTNASLGGADVKDATLAGVTWVFTTCPDETNSDHDGGTCVGHLTH